MGEGKYFRNWFSNFIPLETPFKYEGITFKTVENFYQAMKIPRENLSLRKQVADLSPGDAKRFCSARARNFTLRPDWEDIKIEVMRYALKIKFTPGTEWHDKLYFSQGPIIEWNNWHDNIWGDCVCRRCRGVPGNNLLGKLLMEIRDQK